MKCIICEKECTGATCSGACRAKLSRRNKNEQGQAHAHAIDESARIDAHVPPCTPDQLTSSCLACKACQYESKCEYRANMNAAKPGDADYKGVCAEVDGVWRATG